MLIAAVLLASGVVAACGSSSGDTDSDGRTRVVFWHGQVDVAEQAAVAREFALSNSDLVSSGQWVGFANYRKLMDDPAFRDAVGNTLLFTPIIVLS